MAQVNLGDYVDVPTRLRLALDRWPELRIQEEKPEIVVVDGHTFISVTVTVWRTPDDPLPTFGTAWEPFPGRTPYTRDSEMMNASTSALGRALGFLGLGIAKSIATQEEVRVRVADRGSAPEAPRSPSERPAPAQAPSTADGPSQPQLRKLSALKYAGPVPKTKREASQLIDQLMNPTPTEEEEPPF